MPIDDYNMVCHEDDHLLAINKPAGWNTHAPDTYAGEGVYDWLKAREPRWSSLAIIHRLDKDTSGILLFSKTRTGNQSLTAQFSNRTVQKRYRLLTDKSVAQNEFQINSSLVRQGSKYVSEANLAKGQKATTNFKVIARKENHTLLEASPITGRTHQIRVHAADHGFPIIGDTLYGGTPSHRLHLHSRQLTCLHPETNETVLLEASEDFATDPRLVLRNALITDSNAYRLVHGASDGFPDCYVDRFGPQLLLQNKGKLTDAQRRLVTDLQAKLSIDGACHKILTRNIGASSDPSPSPIAGNTPSAPFEIRENELRYEIRFSEGYSTGLFLDQRDNRRKLLTNHVAPEFVPFPKNSSKVLNTFAYTCAFSLCAANSGHTTTSIDLSRKYLEWGKRNFELNGIAADDHDFIYGDVFDWMRRFAKRDRRFDLILLDPPTFSRSKVSGTFQAEKDYGKLVRAALKILNRDGTLFCSTNAAKLAPASFIETIHQAAKEEGRQIVQEHYCPQPPDFPITREEPGYLKTVWCRC